VTAANSAACYSKLAQMANGAVYVGDNKQAVSHLHDVKLDCLEDLLEELNGESLLVAYEFNHDLDRLRERFGVVVDKVTGRKEIPYLGKGTTAIQETKWIQQWNRGELPLLCAHPASAGHGLNMQGASACNVAWFGIPWDYELYDQFIRRIRRDGTGALQIFNHLLLVKSTMDELKLQALRGKDLTQSGLMRALNAEIRRDAGTLATGEHVANGRNETMVAKLTRPGAPAAAPAPAPQAQQEPQAAVQPKGWANRGAAAPAADAPQDQQERIQEQINPEKAPVRAAGFGRPGSQTAEPQADQQPDANVTEKPARTRAPRAQKDDAPASAAPSVEVVAAIVRDAAASAGAGRERLVAARVEVLKIAFADPAMEVADGLEIADLLWKWADAPF